MESKNTQKEYAWLGLRFLVLPLFLVAPFWLIKYTSAHCYTALLPTHNPLHPAEKVLTGVMQVNSNPHYYGWLLFAIFLTFMIVSFLQVGRKKYRLRFGRARQQLIVALLSVLVTLPFYIYLYGRSQNKYPPNWWCQESAKVGTNLLHGGLNTHAHVGLGIAPVLAIVITLVYLVAPLTALLVTRPSSKKLWQN